MKNSVFSFVIAGCCAAVASGVLPVNAGVNVTQHHNNLSRDGLYIAPAFTQAAAANLTRNTGFDGTIVGNVYAQPLYVEDGPSGPLVIAVTESNNVYALNATTGAIVWQRNVGAAVTSGLPCGNINPLGITSTPVVDLASRALFFNAEVAGSGHQVFSLNVDTGATNPGWPVTVSGALPGFDSDRSQSQRAALTVVGNTVYVPYGGRFGDCGSYRGRVVGIQINNPTAVAAYATTVGRAGIWGPGGIASDGSNIYVTTGNGNTAATWGGAEAVIRLQPGPVFSGATADFWAPLNWMALDSADADLGGSGPIVLDVPGATPSALVLAIGKDRNAYLMNRSNLGGVSVPLAQSNVSTAGGSIIGAAAAYRTSLGTFVALRPTTGTLTAFRITAANPPAIATGWSVSSSGRTAPFVTSTDGTNNAIVWAAGSDGRLRGYNGESGSLVFAGGGANELMAGIRSFNTGIVARARIYYAADNKVYSFGVPVPALQTASAISRKTHGSAGDFDIPLPLTGTSGVESRSGGAGDNHTIIVTFSNEIVSGNASVTAGAGSVVGAPTFSGNTMTVNLTGVTNAQITTVSLSSVTDAFGQTLPNTTLDASFLLGDTNGDRFVNAGDALQTRGRSGQATDATNFRSDVNTDGIVNSGDTTIVRSRSGTSVTAPPAANGREAKKSRPSRRLAALSAKEG